MVQDLSFEVLITRVVLVEKISLIYCTSMDAFTFGNELFVRQYDISDLSNIVILRAESRLNKDKYNLIFK